MSEHTRNDYYAADSIQPDSTGYGVRGVANKGKTRLPLAVLAQLKANTNIVKRKEKRLDSSTTRKLQNSFKPVKAHAAECRTRYIWAGIIFGTVSSIVLIIAGLVLLSNRDNVRGWSTIGTGVLLICVVIIVVVVHYRFQFEEHRKKIEKASMESKEKFYHKSLCDFPPDPVLRRGIVNLIRHGQDDCLECRKMRQEEEASNTYKDCSDETQHSDLPPRTGSSSTRSLSSSFENKSNKGNANYRKSPSPRLTRDHRRNHRSQTGLLSSTGVEELSPEKEGIPLHIGERYRARAGKKRASFSFASGSTSNFIGNGNRNNNVKWQNDSQSILLNKTSSVRSLPRYNTQYTMGDGFLPLMRRENWIYSQRRTFANGGLVMKEKTSLSQAPGVYEQETIVYSPEQ